MNLSEFKRASGELMEEMKQGLRGLSEEDLSCIRDFTVGIANSELEVNSRGCVHHHQTFLRGCHRIIESKLLRPQGLTEAKLYYHARRGASRVVAENSLTRYPRRVALRQSNSSSVHVGRNVSRIVQRNFPLASWFRSRARVRLTRMGIANQAFLDILYQLKQLDLLPVVAELPVADVSRRMGTRVDLVVFGKRTHRLHLVEIKFVSAGSWRTNVCRVDEMNISPFSLAVIQLLITERLAERTFGPAYRRLFGRPYVLRVCVNGTEIQEVAR